MFPCVVATKQRDSLAVRDIPILEMSKHELLESLRIDGWEIQRASSKLLRKHARDHPYSFEKNNKIWYLSDADTCVTMSSVYLQALLMAKGHKREVAHFAKLAVC